MAGVRGKNEKFLKRIKEWDVIELVETWVGKEEWKIWKERVSLDGRYKGRGKRIGRIEQGGVFGWDQEEVRSGGGRDGRGEVNNKRDKLVRRKVEGGDAVYKRKYDENFGEGKRGSGGEKRSKGVDRGRLHCEDGRERGVGRRRRRKGEGIEG